MKHIMCPVNYNTGKVELSIPIYEIRTRYAYKKCPNCQSPGYRSNTLLHQDFLEYSGLRWDRNPHVPVSPVSEELMKHIMCPVNYNTGKVELSIPIYESGL